MRRLANEAEARHAAAEEAAQEAEWAAEDEPTLDNEARAHDARQAARAAMVEADEAILRVPYSKDEEDER